MNEEDMIKKDGVDIEDRIKKDGVDIEDRIKKDGVDIEDRIKKDRVNIEDWANKDKKIEITPAIIQSHIDIINSLHYTIADTPENRKKLENYICNVCCKIGCAGEGRYRATDLTMAQINLLTTIVVMRDEGSMELGIGGYDRIITIGDALEPFNPVLADYFKEEEDKEVLHAMLCIAKDKDVSLGKLRIPIGYNIKTNRLLGQ